MIKAQIQFGNFALKRSLLQHLPELLPTVEIALLAICLGERKLMNILVEFKLGLFSHISVPILPTMSLWKSKAPAALKIMEFCNLAIWMQEIEDLFQKQRLK